jgi:hypothetical protein
VVQASRLPRQPGRLHHNTAELILDRHYVHTLSDRAFLEAIVNAARAQGATSMVVNTGAVHDINLAIKLGMAASTGRTIAGGVVRVVSEPGTTQPSFQIIWSAIPKLGPQRERLRHGC